MAVNGTGFGLADDEDDDRRPATNEGDSKMYDVSALERILTTMNDADLTALMQRVTATRKAVRPSLSDGAKLLGQQKQSEGMSTMGAENSPTYRRMWAAENADPFQISDPNAGVSDIEL